MEHRSQLQLQQQQQNIGPEGFEPVAETAYEFRQDLVLGVCFAILAVGALQRVLCQSREAEPVIFTFYCLILFTSLVRSAWLLVPSDVLEPSYAPQSVWAFSEDWLGTFISEVLCTAGSISMFAIFILMIIYWANLLKKVFKDNAVPSRPMMHFWTTVGTLIGVQLLNICLFLAGVYSSQGMILVDSFFLSALALICSIEISLFSHRFRTVLQTLGAINRVSTEAQVRRIVWITISGNIFFLVREAVELSVGITLFMFWKKNKSFGLVFDSKLWDWYILIKYTTEIIILFIMLWILQGKQPAASSQQAAISSVNRKDYRTIEHHQRPPA